MPPDSPSLQELSDPPSLQSIGDILDQFENILILERQRGTSEVNSEQEQVDHRMPEKGVLATEDSDIEMDQVPDSEK